MGPRNTPSRRKAPTVQEDLCLEPRTQTNPEGIHQRQPQEGLYTAIDIASRIPDPVCTKEERKMATMR